MSWSALSSANHKKKTKRTVKEDLIKEQIVQLLREAEAAHAEYVKELGGQDDEWAEWYARFIVDKLKGRGIV